MTTTNRVLIAEDDEDIPELVEIVLRKAGVEVSSHADGISAARAAQSYAGDLYLLDVRMPGMTGLDLCRVLTANADTRAPILLMSANATEDDIAAGFAAGCQDYLPKPFSPRDLLARITTLLANAAAPCAA